VTACSLVGEYEHLGAKTVSLFGSVRLNGAITQVTHYESSVMFFLWQFARVKEKVKFTIM